MAHPPVFYPRHLFRTTRALFLLMLAEFTITAALLALGAITARRVTLDMALLGVAAMLADGIALRLLSELRRLEDESPVPSGTMLLLFDAALIVPVAGLLAVLAGTRLGQ